jgi:RING-box protein 2
MSAQKMSTPNGEADVTGEEMDVGGADLDANKNEKMFTLKKWNAVAMWSWDVECDTCAICRVQVMGKFIN